MDLEEAFRKLSKKEFEQIMFENACATVENQEKLNILNGLYGKLKITPKAIHPGTSDKLLIRKAVKEYSNKYVRLRDVDNAIISGNAVVFDGYFSKFHS